MSTHKPVTLEDFALAVAAAEAAVLTAQQGARALAEAVERRRAEFKGMVANDQTLTNDAKRKDMLAQLELMDGEYLGLQQQHQAAKDAVVMATIEADLQSRLWQVARIEAEAKGRRLGALEY